MRVIVGGENDADGPVGVTIALRAIVPEKPFTLAKLNVVSWLVPTIKVRGGLGEIVKSTTWNVIEEIRCVSEPLFAVTVTV